MATKKLFKEQ